MDVTGALETPVLLRAFLMKGHGVIVHAPPNNAVADLQALGCRFVPLHMNRKGLSPVTKFRIPRDMYRFLARQRLDVMLSYTIKNNLFGAMAAQRLGIPFIPNVTRLGTAFLSGGALKRLATLIYQQAFRRLPSFSSRTRTWAAGRARTAQRIWRIARHRRVSAGACRCHAGSSRLNRRPARLCPCSDRLAADKGRQPTVATAG